MKKYELTIEKEKTTLIFPDPPHSYKKLHHKESFWIAENELESKRSKKVPFSWMKDRGMPFNETGINIILSLEMMAYDCMNMFKGHNVQFLLKDSYVVMYHDNHNKLLKWTYIRYDNPFIWYHSNPKRVLKQAVRFPKSHMEKFKLYTNDNYDTFIKIMDNMNNTFSELCRYE